jgi:predicted Zn-ribbon and HTH transcriptional regulator
MKLPRCSQSDPAERLKSNLRRTVDTLKTKESPTLVNHLVHDVAHLVSVYGQRRLRDEFENILSLSSDKDETLDHVDTTNPRCKECRYYASTDPSQAPECYEDSDDGQSDMMHAANEDLLSKMGAMRNAIFQMEHRQRREVEDLHAEIDRYKELLADTEKKLIKERISNQKLRCNRRAGRHLHDTHEYGIGEYGYGALTVRSCESSSRRSSPLTRPKSAVRSHNS